MAFQETNLSAIDTEITDDDSNEVVAAKTLIHLYLSVFDVYHEPDQATSIGVFAAIDVLRARDLI